MRVTKQNRVKLERGEKRIGNFILKREGSHMKVSDINEVFTHRVRRDVPIGMFLEDAYNELSEENTMRGIGNYFAFLWAVSSVVPDVQFLQDAFKVSEECMKRHPEAYGMPSVEVSDGEDQEIIREEKELKEFEEELKEAVEGKE